MTDSQISVDSLPSIQPVVPNTKTNQDPIQEKGLAPIKPEYIVKSEWIEYDDKFLSEKHQFLSTPSAKPSPTTSTEDGEKRKKCDDNDELEKSDKVDQVEDDSNNAKAESDRQTDRAYKKKLKGQNKNRRNLMFQERKKREPRLHSRPQQNADNNNNNNDNEDYQNFQPMRMCLKYCRDGICSFGDRCSFSHDLARYAATEREPDIGPDCYCFQQFGKCNFGILCRFGRSHLRADMHNIINDNNENNNNVEENNQTNEEEDCKTKSQVANLLSKDLQISLRKKKYDFKRANACSSSVSKKSFSGALANIGGEDLKKTKSMIRFDESRPLTLRASAVRDFRGQLYLAPLTTVGNLPFRRICKSFGADITCGEMALCTNVLEGSQAEWALLRRHSSENKFGVQICGSSTDQLARVAQLICEQCEIDFIDLNMGCPIDLIYRRGAGAALMERRKKLDEIIYCMSTVADVPLTLKMRTGVYTNRPIARELLGSIAHDWTPDRIGLITLHGRSREQRYTRSADWNYIRDCAQAMTNAKSLNHNNDNSLDDPNIQVFESTNSTLQTIPLFGSGDIISHEEYYERLAEADVAGCMIARGALIKPWIFTEIRERRTWDISSAERFDMLRRFANYGLENWGSDTEGVEKTRRFLLEWQSFLHRYIPVGVLERLPQRVNERPPRYVGRDELETLLSSASCRDWIKISEMLLGPVPADFTFIPKHKANAY